MGVEREYPREGEEGERDMKLSVDEIVQVRSLTFFALSDPRGGTECER